MWHTVKYTADASAFGVTVAALQGWLPSMSAALSIIYMCIQISIAASKWLQRREYARGPRGKQGVRGVPGKQTEVEIKAIPTPDKEGVVVHILPKDDTEKKV